MDRLNPAELAGVRQLGGELEVVDVATLRAGLEDAFVAIDRVGEFLALADRHAAGLLAINVLARLGGEDAEQRVPAISGGNEHGVDVGTPQHLVHVASLDAVLVVVLPVDHHADHFAARLLDVGNHDKLDVGLAQKALEHLAPARTDADAADHDAVARRHRAVLPEGGRRNDRRHADGDGRGFQEAAAGDWGSHGISKYHSGEPGRGLGPNARTKKHSTAGGRK